MPRRRQRSARGGGGGGQRSLSGAPGKKLLAGDETSASVGRAKGRRPRCRGRDIDEEKRGIPFLILRKYDPRKRGEGRDSLPQKTLYASGGGRR